MVMKEPADKLVDKLHTNNIHDDFACVFIGPGECVLLAHLGRLIYLPFGCVVLADDSGGPEEPEEDQSQGSYCSIDTNRNAEALPVSRHVTVVPGCCARL